MRAEFTEEVQTKEIDGILCGVRIEPRATGFKKDVFLYKNITEKSNDNNGTGEKKYEAEILKFVMVEVDANDVLNHFNYYWCKTEKDELQENKKLIIAKLAAIDDKSTRPVRAVLSGENSEEDMETLKELEAQAKAVRAELTQLQNRERQLQAEIDKELKVQI